MRKAAGIAVSLAAALVLAACTSGPGGREPGRGGPLSANPSAVIATEFAFARMAREKGQWTAFAEYAADDAVMFVPEAVNAREWLKGRADPAESVEWRPQQVWSSCDGSVVVSKGEWQQPGQGTSGYFTTIWRRQDNGTYKWVLDHGEALDQPLSSPEMIAAKVATCDPRAERPAPDTPPAGSGLLSGGASDGSLLWSVRATPAGDRLVTASIWNGQSYDQIVEDTVQAAKAVQ